MSQTKMFINNGGETVTNYKKNIFAGSILSLFSLLYLYNTFAIRPFTGIGSTPLDNRFMPRFWGICLLLLSVILLIRGFNELRKASPEKTKGNKRETFINFFNEYREVILTFTALIIYIAMMGAVGFLIMSAIYIFAQIIILSKITKRNIIFALIIAVTSSVLVTYVFTAHLPILLPRGILGF